MFQTNIGQYQISEKTLIAASNRSLHPQLSSCQNNLRKITNTQNIFPTLYIQHYNLFVQHSSFSLRCCYTANNWGV